MKFQKFIKKARDKFSGDSVQRLYLPPYRINLFHSCGLKYRMKFIQKVPVKFQESPHLSFNKSVKTFVQDWLRGQISLDDNLSGLQKHLESHWVSSGYSSAEEESDFRSNAYSGIQKLQENAGVFPGTPERTLWKFKCRSSRVDTGAVLDRVDVTDDEVILTDFKTGKRVIGEERLYTDTHANLYAWAAFETWPGKTLRVRFYYFVPGVSIERVFTPEDIARFRENLDETARLISEDTFVESMSPLCSVCEFLETCSAWPVKPIEISGETIEVFKKRLRLSYSKMSQYENCPAVYRKVYVEKVPSKPRPFFSFGTAIHETFEDVYRGGKLDTVPTLEEVLGYFDKRFASNLIGYSSEEEKNKYYKDGRRHVEMYYNRFLRDQQFNGIEYRVERYFEVPIGKHAVMIGFIDRIDCHPDGTSEILDYKTEPTMREQKKVDTDLQLTIYYWAASRTMGLNIRNLSLFMLDFDTCVTTTRSDDDIPALVEHVDRVCLEIMNDTEYLPRKNKYCKSCDYLGECPLREEILADASLQSMQKF